MGEKVNYEVIRTDTIKKIQQLREHYATEGWEEEQQIVNSYRIFRFGGRDSEEYRNIVSGAEHASYQMILNIVHYLLKSYDYEVDTIGNQQGEILYFVVHYSGKNIVYAFKEYGINNRWKIDYEKQVKDRHKAEQIIYVSFVWDGAYLEVINHNEDVNDLSRGTGCISVKDFFCSLFGEDEFALFKKEMKDFSEEVMYYMGLHVIKTLQPNALYRFKQITEKRIKLEFDYRYILQENIEETQLSLIEKNYFEDGLYEVLTGRSKIAESFLTSEWLYDSFKNTAGKIDYTVVALGYLKAIEQLLYQYIVLYSDDEKQRTLKRQFIKGDEKYSDKEYSRYVPVNEENIKDKRLDTSLGSMVNSFYCYKGNDDLIRKEINKKTIDYVKSYLSDVIPLRNGYFHKDNLDSWERVEAARTSAFVISFLLLGTHIVPEEKKEAFIDKQSVENPDYYKLCEFIRDHPQRAYFFYGSNSTDSIPFITRVEAEYDRNGDCSFGNIVARPLGRNEEIIINEAHLPLKIESVVLNFMGIYDGSRFDFTKLFDGEKELVFCKGKYCATQMTEVYKY